MSHSSPTFGDFYDEVAETEFAEGIVWLEEWSQHVEDRVWQEARGALIDANNINCLAEAMVAAFQTRMQNICTDALYQSTLERGHAFLQEIQSIATEFGVDVTEVINTPITPTELVARAS